MSEVLFRNACKLEESGNTAHAAMLYREMLNHSPDARAAINLGTIHYNRGEYTIAADLYRRATLLDPKNVLALFNLGIVLDELKSYASAVRTYQQAIGINPRHADSHYNLARALELSGKPRKALKHWRIYVQLDPAGPWADFARKAIRKTLAAERLQLVR